MFFVNSKGKACYMGVCVCLKIGSDTLFGYCLVWPGSQHNVMIFIY